MHYPRLPANKRRGGAVPPPRRCLGRGRSEARRVVAPLRDLAVRPTPRAIPRAVSATLDGEPPHLARGRPKEGRAARAAHELDRELVQERAHLFAVVACRASHTVPMPRLCRVHVTPLLLLHRAQMHKHAQMHMARGNADAPCTHAAHKVTQHRRPTALHMHYTCTAHALHMHCICTAHALHMHTHTHMRRACLS